MEESRLQASHLLQSSLQSNGDRRYATPPQQIAAHNRKSLPQHLDHLARPYAVTERTQDVLFGEEVNRVANIFSRTGVFHSVFFFFRFSI